MEWTVKRVAMLSRVYVDLEHVDGARVEIAGADVGAAAAVMTAPQREALAAFAVGLAFAVETLGVDVEAIAADVRAAVRS